MNLKIPFLILLCLLTFGCENKEIKTYIKDDDFVSISYPVTNISFLDEAISSYITKVKAEFDLNRNKKELNISYTYKEVNDDIVSVGFQTEIITDKKINKIKTFTYNRKSNKFLTLDDIAKDLNVFDDDIKKSLLKEYQNADMEYLNGISYEYFTIGDENLTLYFNPTLLNLDYDEIVHLDIPLNSLDLLIDIDKTQSNDYYFNIKKRNINLDDKVVALTFDDGPSRYTEGILDILKKNDACGTFFIIGNKVEFYGDVLRKMLEYNNEIGNHSYDHKYLTRLSESEFKEEVNKTQEVIKKETGYSPTLFRPSYGGYNDTLKSYTDLKFVLWDVDSRDWSVKSKDRILKNVLPNVKSGSIILMHDNHEYALNALEDMIKSLKDDGYKFVTVSELLEFKKIRDS